MHFFFAKLSILESGLHGELNPYVTVGLCLPLKQLFDVEKHWKKQLILPFRQQQTGVCVGFHLD